MSELAGVPKQREDVEEPMCDQCGFPMESRACKIQCKNCGFMRDCSDP
jgi:hypothetical protein